MEVLTKRKALIEHMLILLLLLIKGVCRITNRRKLHHSRINSGAFYQQVVPLPEYPSVFNTVSVLKAGWSFM